MKRSAGILLPVFSLPGPYGIGTLGKEARAFADFLKAAGQRWWQILPVGPTGAGDSPYTSVSTFAGNPLLLDPEALAAEGLLTQEELDGANVPEGPIDYAALYESRETLLRTAFSRLSGEKAQAIRDFAGQNAWVREFALYQAAKARFGPGISGRTRPCAATSPPPWSTGGESWRRRWPSTPPCSTGSRSSGRR